ncbi:GLPGLI family protein [Elizabethkingia meningoseptica]|uniref:GLPGLI family protein n=1 Tax=Elizabethkingia meningoseptica TaxID=238 RepID=UPI003891EF2D
MHQFPLILLIFISFLSKAQTRRFVYEYIEVPDSTDIINRKTHIMFLDINDKGSDFFDGEKYQSDSTMISMAKNNQFIMPPREAKFVAYRITKKYPSYNLTFIISDYNNRFYVSDTRKQTWVIKKDTDFYKNYRIQKATTRFGGRHWTAWFTADIPVPDGPYKFHGLPGLILKLEDTGANHKFNLIGIKNNIKSYDYPITDMWRKKLNLSLEKYRDIYREYRKDPAKNYRMDVVAGNVYESIGENGEIETPNQKLRDREVSLKAEISKDNNIIEIDLLK